MHLHKFTIYFRNTQKPFICSSALNNTFINIAHRFFVSKGFSDQSSNVNKNSINLEEDYEEYESPSEQFDALEGGFYNSESPKVVSPKGSKILKAAIVGTPNAGKSTLINQIVGRQIFAISKKVHTTRCRARGVLNEENTQLVFLDTPGLVTGRESDKYKLEKSFLSDGETSIKEADVVGVVHDVCGDRNSERLDPKVLRLLHFYPDKHTILIINKIDQLKSRRVLLDVVDNLTCTRSSASKKVSNKEEEWRPKTEFSVSKAVKNQIGWPNFKQVFMVSALKGSGTKEIRDYLISNAQPGDWLFPKHIFTDQTYIKIIEETVKSKLLDFLPKEVPYSLVTQLEYYDRQVDGTITTVVLIGCKTPRIERLVMGGGGKRIKVIAKECEEALANAFRAYVKLRLVVSKKRPHNVDVEELVKSGRLELLHEKS